MSVIPVTDSSSVWLQTISEAVKCIGSVYFNHHEAVELDHPLKSEATGFVVDKENGIIITNRHVVGAGVFAGKIKFHNQEECKVTAIYRDPVHDFGFLKFDPKDIKHMTVGEIQLRPDQAKVGTEIRVVGNDSGQQLSILSGFLSRLQRNTPEYGEGTYNDFNTFYIQAAANAKGGSSGSPVINVDGHAVALQAGGMTFSSTDYFLPLQRVKRALELVRNNEVVPRGDIQTIWKHEAFNVCEHYGLDPEIETRFRQKFADNVGMLVATRVIEGGPSFGKIETGDILVSVDGQDVCDFAVLDELLDTTVGQEHEVVTFRDDRLVTSKVKVCDLHSLCARSYIKFGGMTFHESTYQLARSTCEPIAGVVVSCGGPTDVNCRSKLLKINGTAIKDMDQLLEILKGVSHGASNTVEFQMFRSSTPDTRSVRFDLHFYPDFFRATLSTFGVWDKQRIEHGGKIAKVQDKKHISLDSLKEIKDSPYVDILRSFVTITVSRPVNCDSMDSINGGEHCDEEFNKCGFVVDTKLGLIVTTDIGSYFSTLFITFFNQVRLPVKIKYIDLQSSFALLQYDPSMLDAPLQALELEKERHEFAVGEKFYSFSPDPTKLMCPRIDNSLLSIRYGSGAYESVSTLLLEYELEKHVSTGVLVSPETNKVIGLVGNSSGWRSRPRGVHELARVVDLVRQGAPIPEKRYMNAYFSATTILSARDCGLSEERVAEAVNGVYSCVYTSDDTTLEVGDIILQINGSPVKEDDFDLFSTAVEFSALVLRDKKEVEIAVNTIPVSELTTSHLVTWCENVVQRPWLDVWQQYAQKWPSEIIIYVDQQDLSDLDVTNICFVTHVNSKPVKTVEDFLKLVLAVPSGSYATLGLKEDCCGPKTTTIYCDYEHNPTVEYLRSDDGHWKRTEYGVSGQRVVEWDEWSPKEEDDGQK